MTKKTMKALVKFAAGPGNLELQDIPVPEIGDDDILIKISYCGICGSDLHIEKGIHPCDPPVPWKLMKLAPPSMTTP